MNKYIIQLGNIHENTTKITPEDFESNSLGFDYDYIENVSDDEIHNNDSVFYERFPIYMIVNAKKGFIYISRENLIDNYLKMLYEIEHIISKEINDIKERDDRFKLKTYITKDSIVSTIDGNIIIFHNDLCSITYDNLEFLSQLYNQNNDKAITMKIVNVLRCKV